MPEDYGKLIYQGMQAAYGEKGFTKPEDEFLDAINNDPEYRNLIYQGMNAFYGEKGFKLSPEEFSSKFKPTEVERNIYAEVDEEQEPVGFLEGLGRSVKGYVTTQLPAVPFDLSALIMRTATKNIYDEADKEQLFQESSAFLDELKTREDSPWNLEQIEQAKQSLTKFKDAPLSPLIIETVKAGKEWKDKANYDGMAVKISDVYDFETGEFKPENLGSFIGFGLGQTLPQIAINYLTGGTALIPMGLSEGFGQQIDAFEKNGKTVEEVFLSGDDKVAEAWAAGIAIGLLDKVGFNRIKGGGATVKTIKDVFSRGISSAIWEGLTEAVQETVGAVGGQIATRDWDSVRELVSSPEFWIDQVGTSGAMGFMGGQFTSTVGASIEGGLNKLSPEVQSDINTVASELGNAPVVETVTEDNINTAVEAEIKEVENIAEENNVTENETQPVTKAYDDLLNQLEEAALEKARPLTETKEETAPKAERTESKPRVKKEEAPVADETKQKQEEKKPSIKEDDAIQKQKTESVPTRSETKAGEKVGQEVRGKDTTKKEVKQEKKVVSKPKQQDGQKTESKPADKKATDVSPKVPVVEETKVSDSVKEAAVKEEVKPEKTKAQIKQEKQEEEKRYKNIDLQNRGTAIVERDGYSRKNKIKDLNNLATKAREQGFEEAAKSAEKKRDKIQAELEEEAAVKQQRAEREARKNQLVEPEKRNDGEAMGFNRNGDPVYQDKSGNRFVVENGKKKSKGVKEQNLYTSDEMDTRAKIRTANNRKVEAFKKKAQPLMEQIIGYTQQAKASKDAGTKAAYQEAAKNAQAELDKIQKELVDWRKKPMRGDEDMSGLIKFEDNTKVENALNEVKEKAKLTPRKRLPVKRAGRRKETLSEKERKPMMEGEKIRREQVEDEIGDMISIMDGQIELNKVDGAKFEDLHKRADAQGKRKLDEAYERMEERKFEEEQDRIDKQMEEEGMMSMKEDDYLLSDDFDFDFRASELNELDQQGTDWRVRFEGEKRVENGDQLNQALGITDTNIFTKRIASLTVQLLNKINATRKAAGIPAIEIYVADKISLASEENGRVVDRGTAAGIALRDKKHGTNRMGIVIKAGDGITQIHELLHIWNFMVDAMSYDGRSKFAKLFSKEQTAVDDFYSAINSLSSTFYSGLNKALHRWETGQEATSKNEELVFEIFDMMHENGQAQYFFKKGADGRTRVNLVDGVLDGDKEFLAYIMTEPEIATLANLIDSKGNVVADNAQTFNSNSIFRKIVQTFLDIAQKLGVKINKDTILADTLEELDFFDALMAENAEFNFRNITDSQVLLRKAGKQNQRKKLLKDTILKDATSKKAAQEIINALNSKLSDEAKITADERKYILDMFSKGTEKKRSAEIKEGMIKNTRPERFRAKDKKNVKGIRADAETIDLVTEIHAVLNKEYSDQEKDQAMAHYEELSNKKLESELSDNEEKSYLIARFAIFDELDFNSKKDLQRELETILRDGALERRRIQDQKKNERKLRTELGLKNMPWLEDGKVTDEAYEKAVKKHTKQAEDSMWGRFVKHLSNTASDWGVTHESFHSVLDLIGTGEVGAEAKKTFFNREFGTRERKALIKKKELIHDWNTQVLNKIGEIFKVADKKAIIKKMESLHEERYIIEYFDENTGEKRGGNTKYSLDQIAQIWMWSKQEGTEKNFLKHGYGADFINQVNAIMNSNKEMKEFAQWALEEFYVERYNDINPIYKARMGHTLPSTENYSPLVYDYRGKASDEGVSLDESQFSPVTSTLRSFVMKRKSNTQKLDFKTGMMSQINSHVYNAAHFVAYDALVSELRSFFGDADVKAALEMKFGKRMNLVLRIMTDSLAKENVIKSRIHTTMDKLRAALVTAFLGANPTIYFKQLSSMFAYDAHMPTGYSWKKMQLEALNPRSEMAKKKAKWINKIKEHPIFIDRVKRGKRSMGEAERSELDQMLFGERVNETRLAKIQRWSMGLVKAGDMGAITQGGWATLEAEYDRRIKQGMSKKAAEEEAFVIFIQNTLDAQQSTETADLSVVQLDNHAYAKFFTAFSTTPMQYLRNAKSAGRAMKRNGYLKTREGRRAAYQLAMYSIILPVIFQSVSQAFRFMWTDDEEERSSLIARLAYAPLQSVFSANLIVGGIIDTTLRKVMLGEDFGSYSGLVGSAGELFSGFASVVEKLATDKEITEREYMQMMDFIGVMAGGLPIGNAAEMAKGAYDMATGEGDILNVLGWSDYSLGRGKESKTKKEQPKVKRESPNRRLMNRRLQRRR